MICFSCFPLFFKVSSFASSHVGPGLAYAVHINVSYASVGFLKDRPKRQSDAANVPRLVEQTRYGQTICGIKLRESVPWPVSVEVRNCMSLSLEHFFRQKSEMRSAGKRVMGREEVCFG